MFYTKDISPASSPEISPIQSQKKTGEKAAQAFQRLTAEIPGSSHISGSGLVPDPASISTRLGKHKAEHRPDSSPDESSPEARSHAEPHEKYRKISVSHEQKEITASIKEREILTTMETTHNQCCKKLSAGDLIGTEKLIYAFYQIHPHLKSKLDKTQHSNEFFKLSNAIKNIMRGLKFIRTQHYYQQGNKVCWNFLRRPSSSFNPNESQLNEAVVFVQAILLNKEAKPSSTEWHRECLIQARKHLEWIKECERLPVSVHNIWFECMFELCTQELESNHIQASKKEYDAFNKTKKFLNKTKQCDKYQQLIDLLDKHVEWVRDKKFSSLSIRSLAYCCYCLYPYADTIKKAQQRKSFINQIEKYYRAYSTIHLGTTLMHQEDLINLARNFDFLGIPVEHYPELMPNLLDAWHSMIRNPGTYDANLKRYVERAGAIASPEYIKALADIRERKYSEASKRIRRIYEKATSLDNNERNSLSILGAYIFFCANENKHAYQWLVDCDPYPGTQPYLQKARLYSMLGNSERALELLELKMKYPDRLLSLAYNHAIKEIKDSLSDASSSSTDSDTKLVIATKKDPEPEEEETARQLKELEAKCQELEAKCQELQKKNDEWEAVEKELKAKNRKLVMDLNKSEEICDAFKSSYSVCESQIETLVDFNTTLKKELDESKMTCEAYKNSYNEKSTLEIKLKEQLINKEKEYKALETELLQTTEQRKKETNQLMLQLEATKNDLNHFKLKHSTLSAANSIHEKNNRKFKK